VFHDTTFNRTVDNLRPADIFNHMVEQSQSLDLVFHALGDATRRAMLHRLAAREHTVGELAEPYAMSLASVSKHIKALERAGLVTRRVRGRIHYCRLNPRPLEKADGWLRAYERLWDLRLARLEELLRHPDDTAHP
jgi:DNA-binding transcriptional ArsR family regulator